MHEAIGRQRSRQPYAALAAVDEVLFGLVALRQRLLVVAEVDEQLVFIHPIIEVVEFLDDLVLDGVDGLTLHPPLLQRGGGLARCSVIAHKMIISILRYLGYHPEGYSPL